MKGPVRLPGAWPPWLVRVLVAVVLTQSALNLARPATSYRALALGADARAVGLITAAYAVVPVLVAVSLGRLADRRSPAPLFLVGAVALFAGCAFLAMAASLAQVGVASAVLGVRASRVHGRRADLDRHPVGPGPPGPRLRLVHRPDVAQAAGRPGTRGSGDGGRRWVVKSQLDSSGVDYQLRQLVGGHEPADEVLNVAKEVDADLIVIGLRRRTPVGKLILGSTAQRILLGSTGSVLSVKASDRAPEAS